MPKSSIKTEPRTVTATAGSGARVIFFGSFEFAVPVLDALARPVRNHEGSQCASVSSGVKAGYEIVAVITNPDKPAGRKQTLTPPPVKVAAEKLGLNILQPQILKDPEFLKILNTKYKIQDTNIGIVVGYGKIIPPEIFNLPKHGTLVIHPSLLPKYRGPSPVQTAMLNGDLDTGVTIMKIDEELDHGDIVAATEYKLSPDISYEKAHDALFKLGADLLIKILPEYLAGKIKPIPQEHSKATFTKKFKTEDGEILPGDTPEMAYRKIRAFNPEPGAYIWLNENETKMRLKILSAELINGRLKFKKVQPEGGKPMTIEEFLAGHPAELDHPNFKENLLQ